MLLDVSRALSYAFSYAFFYLQSIFRVLTLTATVFDEFDR